jgi:hypothetical protein
MKHPTPDSLLSRALLCFVRDNAPTGEEVWHVYYGPGGPPASPWES